ncbi:hypothetical protein PV08_09274 [Exophiala spinifera]|uniref:EamA domain-containing protein n=1 Tax=Exophiala spinifera TaxID=91928 RepID=A0A0D2B017_9EURO|nr:uncharacterized protein PV08_09274 [Exophiala spinifera]KIW12000.1 hypothetical protein PV08_09274 [Exophiala spinifera]
MDDRDVRRDSSRQRLLDADESPYDTNPGARRAGMAGLARHTLGLMLLLLVVFLWTLSNFLGSIFCIEDTNEDRKTWQSIFADKTYAKPFFLTYLNTSMFMLAMIPTLVRIGYRRQRDHGDLYTRLRTALSEGRRGAYRRLPNGDDGAVDPEGSGRREEEGEEDVAFLAPDPETSSSSSPSSSSRSDDLGLGRRQLEREHEAEADEKEGAKHLAIAPTARLALTFCILWFGANYFAMACLQHTTVASTTILTSTSSIWTLLIGASTGTEKFTWRKLLGVLGSVVGIILISHVDLSGTSPEVGVDGGSPSPTRRAIDVFPDKSASEMMLGNAMALLSAVIYGMYTITLKKTTVKALPRSLNMPLFFGLVGLWNIVLLWPLFPILHFSGLERFALPPTRHVWTILLVNSMSSLFSDICWAYAMVLTSPLVVTVGLSLTIPLSLVGEMVLQGRYEGITYWVGAAIVVGSFVFVDHEEREEEQEEERDQRLLPSAGGQVMHLHPEGDEAATAAAAAILARDNHGGASHTELAKTMVAGQPAKVAEGSNLPSNSALPSGAGPSHPKRK